MWIFRLVLISTLVGREYSLDLLYIVLLEHIYSQLGVPVKTYPCRGKLFLHVSISSTNQDFEGLNEARPRLVLHVSEIERENQIEELGMYSVVLLRFAYC
jgi:hypothetical protein